MRLLRELEQEVTDQKLLETDHPFFSSFSYNCLNSLIRKGASGEAVQNMNIMLGYPETMGLDGLPLAP